MLLHSSDVECNTHNNADENLFNNESAPEF